MNQGLQASIRQIWAAVHSPSGLPFPSTVGQLQSLGVTRYRVDYISRTITAYTSTNEFDAAPFPSSHAYTAGHSWSEDGIVAAIRRAQAGEGNYYDFSDAIVQSGVTDYTAYLEGKKVVYSGALGEMREEWFPGAKPAAKD